MHAARAISPMHPISYLHIGEATETIKAKRESFIKDRKKLLWAQVGGGLNPSPPGRSTPGNVFKGDIKLERLEL